MPERHPVLRTGEREPIDPYKRALIHERDGHACCWCGQGGGANHAREVVLELDHVVPWSAMGSDRSDNLRTLCPRCNEVRSNFIDENPPRLIGVTTACYWCMRKPRLTEKAYFRLRREGRIDKLGNWDEPTRDAPHIPAYCGRCGGTSWVPTERWIL